ncbi:MAG: hypothetical protein EOP14_06735, partial [Pseudomonas sp.]
MFLSVGLLLAAAQPVLAQTLAASEPKLTTVEMRSLTFLPKSVTIEPGQAVLWKNVSYTDHSATSSDDTKAWDTTMIPAKASS